LNVDKIANRIFGKFDLSLAQYKILTCLYATPAETVTTAELESHFQMSHSTAVGLLNHLEREGWIVRTKGGRSRRSKVIVATEKAERVRADLEHAGMQLESEFTRNLSEREIQEYVRLSRKILGIAQ